MKNILYEDTDVIKINEELFDVASQLFGQKRMRIKIEDLCCEEIESLYKETYDILNQDEIKYSDLIQIYK